MLIDETLWSGGVSDDDNGVAVAMTPDPSTNNAMASVHAAITKVFATAV
jgi:hypothetical protein